jgi:hypothetical protein
VFNLVEVLVLSQLAILAVVTAPSLIFSAVRASVLILV